jgi:hypothetical protein
MARPRTLAALARFAAASGDPYLAIPVYPFVQGAMAEDLEAIILAKPRHRLVFAAMTFVPARLLARLAEEPNAQIAIRLAANPATPAEARVGLADRWANDTRVRRALAARDKEAASFGAKPRARTDRALARRADLSADTAARLSTSADSWVRRWLGRNPATPPEILGCLAADPDLQVRRAVGRNPACPAHLLSVLARDPAPWVRAAIAFRHDVSAEIVDLLTEDDDADVLSGLGRNPAAPPDLLRRIAGSNDADIRRAVILNRAAPGPVLEMLLEDPYPFNRALLAVHPGLPDEAAWNFVNDPEPEIRYRAMARAVKNCARAKATSGYSPSLRASGPKRSRASRASSGLPRSARDDGGLGLAIQCSDSVGR